MIKKLANVFVNLEYGNVDDILSGMAHIVCPYPIGASYFSKDEK